MIAAVAARAVLPERTAALVARLATLAPRVRVEGPGLFLCDLAGLPGAPSAHGRRLVAACGGAASAGIASVALVARIVAERTPPPDVRVVEDGPAYLAPLPLATLPLDPRLVAELRLLGLHRVADLVALPHGAVLDRFGRAAAHVRALAAGGDAPSEVWDAPPRRIAAERAFDHEVPDAERLVFLLRVLVEEVCAALAADGIAVVRLRLRLARSGEPLVLDRAILPPSREPGVLLRSLRWALEERPGLGGVHGAALEVIAVERLHGRQVGLFAPDGARHEEALTVARQLRARLGAGAVLRARIASADARLPERAAEWSEVVS